MRIAINGFGRIGRNVLRVIMQDPEAQKHLNVVAINIGPAKPEMVAHLFAYDTILGRFDGTVRYQDGLLYVNDHTINILAESDACKLNWKKFDIDWVVESSGRYTARHLQSVHVDVGAKHTLITAPCKGDVTTIIPGINEATFKKHDRVVSLGSCTTNAIIPMLKVLHDAYTIEQGFMTTIHAYTNTQVLVDVEAGDERRSRAAALNIIPTTTGAAKMIDQILPELENKIQALAVRVPVANVSLIDLVIRTQKTSTLESINESFCKASTEKLQTIVQVCDKPLVSNDYTQSDASVVIDTLLTQSDGHMAQIFGWYDNEWGYSTRVKDFLLYVSLS